ncbi:MAG: RNA methyltransferase, partial [Chloroflexota bacterium]
FIEGLHIVAEAIDCDAAIETLVISPELMQSEFGQSQVSRCQQKGTPVLDVSAEIFRSLSHKDGPQGLGAVVRQNWQKLNTIHLQAGQIWVALDSVQNPGNLGSIIRTSESVGARGVILLDQSTDPYDPQAVKASMGALFSQIMVKTDFQGFSDWLKEENVRLIGSSDKADMDYMDAHYPDPCILLMGSEREGLGQDYLNLCDQVVRIPMQGRSDSLNLAIATSIILYQIYNQKRKSVV